MTTEWYSAATIDGSGDDWTDTIEVMSEDVLLRVEWGECEGCGHKHMGDNQWDKIDSKAEKLFNLRNPDE